MFDILVACTREGGIGKNGSIPWYLPPDLKYFRKITTKTVCATKQNAVIMGRNTWHSLHKKPLANRMNVVLTSAENLDDITKDGGHVCRSLDEALSFLKTQEQIENVFVIGGERLYKEALEHAECSSVYATIVESENEHENGNGYECDAFFPIHRLERQGDSMKQWGDFTMVSFTFGFRYKGIYYEFRKYDKVQD